MIDIFLDQSNGHVVVILDYAVIACAAMVSAFGSGWLSGAAYLRARK